MANTSPNPRRVLNSRGVADRFQQKALRTVRRWELAGILPPPDFTVRGRKYWFDDTIEAVERELVAQGLARCLSPNERSANSAAVD